MQKDRVLDSTDPKPIPSFKTQGYVYKASDAYVHSAGVIITSHHDLMKKARSSYKIERSERVYGDKIIPCAEPAAGSP